ncbi:MAG: thioredoxin-dependent peroxiredoxin [candidate division WOR-3 bacterium]
MVCIVGRPAPDFEVDAYFPNGEIKKVKLSDYRGKWVILLFYPADFTFVCPTELVDVATKYEEIKSLNAEVIGISVDTVYVHRVWQEYELSKMIDGGIPFPLASDLGGNVGSQYGVYDDIRCLNLRGTFIIDPDGVLQAVEINNAPVGRNADELVRKLKAFQFVRETGGKEVCPAKWEPGKPTLKPSVDLAGKVHEVYKG